MKVCMISGLALHSGGLENVVNEISSFLVSQHVNVTVFGQSNRDFVRVDSNYREVGIRPYDLLPQSLRKAYYNKVFYSLKVWKRMKAYAPFDIVHGHGDNCFFPSLLRDKKPFMMTFHGTRAKSMARFDPRETPALLAEKIAARKCDLVVACSHAVKKEIIDFYGIEDGKIHVIHNGVNTERFYVQNKTEARKKLNLDAGKIYGIWVALNPKLKRLSTARKAIHNLRNVCLLAVGVSGINEENTVFWGLVKDPALMRTLYSAADFFILPSEYDGFPVASLEALACGLPLLVSKESNMGEIMEEGVHGFVIEDKSPQSYKKKIEFLLNNPEARGRMSEQCRKLAITYSWQNQVRKYWKLYLELLSQN